MLCYAHQSFPTSLSGIVFDREPRSTSNPQRSLPSRLFFPSSFELSTSSLPPYQSSGLCSGTEAIWFVIYYLPTKPRPLGQSPLNSPYRPYYPSIFDPAAMAPVGYEPTPTRDSLELDSLVSSSASASPRSSTSSRSGISSSRRMSIASDDGDVEPGRPRAYRSYSVSSAFDFNTHLVPLTSSTETRYQQLGATNAPGSNPVGTLEKQKTLSYLNGLSLLVGLQIGSGIFSSPSQVNNHTPSPGVSLIVWAVAGLLAWTGAASYAELGGAIPLNGGSGVYLRYCFGELIGFLYSWAAVIVLKPGGAAIIAIISGEYINRVITGSFTADADAVLPSEWANKLAAFLCLSLVTALNILSTRLTTRLSDSLLFLKVGSLLAITIIGIIVAATGLNGDGKGASTEWKDRGWFNSRKGGVSGRESESVVGGLGEYAIALYAGLWAFDGWDNVCLHLNCLHPPMLIIAVGQLCCRGNEECPARSPPSDPQCYACRDYVISPRERGILFGSSGGGDWEKQYGCCGAWALSDLGRVLLTKNRHLVPRCLVQLVVLFLPWLYLFPVLVLSMQPPLPPAALSMLRVKKATFPPSSALWGSVAGATSLADALRVLIKNRSWNASFQFLDAVPPMVNQVSILGTKLRYMLCC